MTHLLAMDVRSITSANVRSANIVIVLLFTAALMDADASADKPSHLSTSPSLVRETRQSYYGSGGYGGSMNSYGGSGGGGGCPACPPYVQCDEKINGLLAFGIGTVLGLLLAALRGGMTMMMAAAPPTPAMMMPAMMMPPMMMGRRQHSSSSADAGIATTEEIREFVERRSVDITSRGPQRRSSSTLLQLLHLPEDAADDLAPILTDALRVFTAKTSSDKERSCLLERWMCQLTQQLHRKGGLRARIGSLTSLIYGWYANASTVRQPSVVSSATITGDDDDAMQSDVDCEFLSPHCNGDHLPIDFSTKDFA